MTTPEQFAALRDGRIDVAFGRLHVHDDTIVRKVIRKAHLLAAQPSVLDQRVPWPSYAELVLRHFHGRGSSRPSALDLGPPDRVA